MKKIYLIILILISSIYAEVSQKVLNTMSSTVKIVLKKNGKAISSGSGFFISSDGKVVTNYHVIEDALSDKNISVSIQLKNGLFTYLKSFYALDKENDIAIFNSQMKKSKSLKLTNSVKVGQDIYNISAPKGVEFSVSEGIVSGIRESGKIIQTTTPISKGSSGSPLLNKNGEVIGIITFLLADSQNLNFAMSSSLIEKVLKNKIISKKVDKKSDNNTNKSIFEKLEIYGNPSNNTEWFSFCHDEFFVESDSFYVNKENKYILSWIKTPNKSIEEKARYIESSLDSGFYRKWMENYDYNTIFFIFNFKENKHAMLKFKYFKKVDNNQIFYKKNNSKLLNVDDFYNNLNWKNRSEYGKNSVMKCFYESFEKFLK